PTGTGTKNALAVSGLTVTFSTVVNVSTGAFELSKLGSGGGAVGVSISTNTVLSGKMVVTLVFSGSFVLPSGALSAGTYNLVTHGDLIHDAGSGLAVDGDNNGTPGGDNIVTFHSPMLLVSQNVNTLLSRDAGRAADVSGAEVLAPMTRPAK